jgi:hypothetical protein
VENILIIIGQNGMCWKIAPVLILWNNCHAARTDDATAKNEILFALTPSLSHWERRQG